MKLLNNKIFILFIVLGVFSPIFLGFSGEKIYFDIVGKFDARVQNQNIFVISLSFFILIIFFFLSSFRFNLGLKLLFLNLLIPVLIYYFINQEFQIKLLKTIFSCLLFFIGFHVFYFFNKKILKKINIIFYVEKIFIILLLILFLNIFSYFFTGESNLITKKIKIYSFYDYYPIIFFPILLFFLFSKNHHTTFLDTNNKNLFLIIYFIMMITIILVSQSRAVFFSTIISFFFIFLTNYSKIFTQKFILSKNCFFLVILMMIFMYIYIATSGTYLLLDFIDLTTLQYRFDLVLDYFKELNLVNFLLPHMDDGSQSYHNQFIEIYNALGIFMIYVSIYFKFIIEKCYDKNPKITVILTFYIFIICLFIVPFGHIYTNIVIAYFYSILAASKIER